MFIIITSSPNAEGLTASCGWAALEGITSAGGEAEIIDISLSKLEPCRVCGDGWGQCRSEGRCVIGGLMPELQSKIRGSDGVVLVTPVYWGQPSERMKYFMDRFRRCEAAKQGGSAAFGKQVALIAAAGGSGNGTVSCLAEMELWCRHVGAIPQERVGITRFNRTAAMLEITDAGARLARGEHFKRP